MVMEVVTIDQNFTPGGCQQPDCHTSNRGFTRAAFSNQGIGLTALNIERNIINGIQKARPGAPVTVMEEQISMAGSGKPSPQA